MPRLTAQPGDESTTAVTRSSAGTSTNTAAGGFSGNGRAVTVTIDAGTLSAQIDSNANGDTATVTCRVEYTTDGGTGWSTLAEAQAVMTVAAHPETQSDSVSFPQSLAIGNVQDLSLLDVRAYVDIVETSGTPTYTTASAQVTDWEITYDVAVGAIWV